MPQYNFDINAAMQAGYTPDQIQAFLAQQKSQGNNYQLTPTPQVTPQQSVQPQPKSNFFADMLPTAGAVVGGIAGAAVPLLGETGIGEVGGSAVGSGLGEAAKELIEGKPLSGRDIATQGVIGGVGGAVGKGISAVAGKVLPNIAEGGASRLMNSVYKEPIKATKASIAKGESLGEQALQRGQAGTTRQLFDAANTQIGNTENTIQKMAMQSPNKVSMDEIRKTVQPLIDKYTQSGNTTAVNALQTRLDAIEAANGSNMPVAAANDIKKALYDEIQKSYGAQASPETEGVKAIARGLKEQVSTAVPGVDQLNKDLSFYGRQRNAMLDKMTKDQRSAVLGLNDTILAAGGAAGMGPLGATLPFAKKALTTTLAKTTTAQSLNNLPASPLATTIGNTLAQTAGQGAARTLLPMQPGSTSNQNDNSNYPSQNTLPPSPIQNNSTIQSDGSQALPSSPTDTTAANPLAGYTINGKPIDPATANLIKQVADYKLDPTKISSLRTADRERLIGLVSQYDPTYDSSQFPVKQSLRKDYTSGTTGKNIQAINTAIGHLYALSNAASDMGNTNFPAINSIKNSIAYNTGNPKVTNFETIANALAGEVAKIYKQNGATDTEIANVEKSLNPNMSPAQFKGNIEATIKLMGSKLDTLNNQYSEAMGRPADFKIIFPESQQILQALQASNDPNALPVNP